MDAARAFIASIREEMPDATHHVYAMKIGFGASVTEGMSDDGEPSGTSGPPVLALLRGSEIGDVVVVVTRYFGGTKLGTGGLVTAYSNAAREALAAVELEPRVDRERVCLNVSYPIYERVKQLVDECEGIIEREDFGVDVHVEAAIAVERIDEFAEKTREVSAGKAKVIRER